MSEFCVDCKLPVSPCGWGAENCNYPETVVGITNVESVRSILGLPGVLEKTFESDERPADG